MGRPDHGICRHRGVTWVVLTNGDEYRIYNAGVPVPFEQKLFRNVRLTDPDRPGREKPWLCSPKSGSTTSVPSGKPTLPTAKFMPPLSKLFSPAPDSLSLLVSFVKKHVKCLTPKEIRASLGRLRASFEFPVNPTKPVGGTETITNAGAGVERYVEFWSPIRTEPNGLFAGKPAGGYWIGRAVKRGICGLSLVVYKHACCVDLGFYKGDKGDRAKRRDNALKLLPATEYPREPHETTIPPTSVFRPHKGIKDRDHWPEMRKKLKSLGEQIING